MIRKISLFFDDSEFPQETALSLAREGVRRTIQNNETSPIAIISVFGNRNDAEVTIERDRIIIKKV